MIAFHRGKTHLCEGWTRREFLRVGGLGAAGLTLADWFRAQEAGAVNERKTKSVILIFNCGAPSHVDLWDMKPNAPADVRGPFRPIKTNVPGIEISELIPELAKRAHMYSIVRTVHHTQSSHNAGMYSAIVGRPYKMDSTLINPAPDDYPSFATLTNWLAQAKEGYNKALPPYVITPKPHRDGPYITPGQYGGFLGNRFDPYVLDADPNKPDFKVTSFGPSEGTTVARVQTRRSVLEAFNSALRTIDNAPDLQNLDAAQQKAFDLMTSADVRKAFDLSREPDKVRDRYGRHMWGQSHLLARRLIEAGAKIVTTVNGDGIVWDTHENNFDRLKNDLVPPMEKAFVALLDDLKERGLLDTTLVIWMGDFGRTPKINPAKGRDHWPYCYSVIMAGAGIQGGLVVGESDATGAYPAVRPVKAADVHATVFSALGYDPHKTEFPSPDGRPMLLSYGEPVHELL